jgi:hypothetical protein
VCQSEKSSFTDAKKNSVQILARIMQIKCQNRMTVEVAAKVEQSLFSLTLTVIASLDKQKVRREEKES